MPRIVDHDKKRALLLEGAHRLFVDRGYHEVSMRSLAKELGVSTGTLYHYFQGKEQLFEDLVRTRATADVAEATQGLDPHADPNARLQRLARFVLEHHHRLRETLLLVLEYERTQPGPSDVVQASLDAYRGPLVAALGVEAGALGLSLILGLLVQQILQEQPPNVASHLRALSRLAP